MDTIRSYLLQDAHGGNAAFPFTVLVSHAGWKKQRCAADWSISSFILKENTATAAATLPTERPLAVSSSGRGNITMVHGDE